MCGIGAIIWLSGKRNPSLTKKFTIQAIKDNSVRGTDASGIAALRFRDEPEVFYFKLPLHPKIFAFELEQLADEYGWHNAQIAIFHDRAYTSCPPYNNLCNHPLHIKFSDGTALFLVHNGVIYGQYSHDYDLDVDSFRLLAKYRDSYEKTNDPLIAMSEALTLAGSKAILAFHVTNETTYFYYFRHANPLNVARLGDALLFSSIEQPIRKMLKKNEAKISSVAEDRLYAIVFSNTPWKMIAQTDVKIETSEWWEAYYTGRRW